MRRIAWRLAFVALLVCVSDARGQSTPRHPHIGYIYPAGGRQGEVFHILVGGQYLRGTSDVHITGDGIQAKVIKHYRPLRNLSSEQRQLVRTRLRECSEKRWDELHKQGKVGPNPPWGRIAPKDAKRGQKKKSSDSEPTEPVELPEHPLFEDLDKKSLRELRHIRDTLFNAKRRQQNMQIAETVLIEVTVDSDAEIGDRELRLNSRAGLTNPMLFQVGALPEVCEIESNDPLADDSLPEEPPLDLPVLVNGQIMPGDVDRFRFNAEQGQQLVIEAHARHLVPFLADAVPGWFQATLTLLDPEGREVGFVDDFRFDPDPVLFYEVPTDGVYELEVRDSIYRGREDFVYRISIGEQPFITSAFPLGSRVGHGRYTTIAGKNISSKRLFLDTRSDDEGIRQKTWGRGKRSSNPITYAVDSLRATSESESNDTIDDAQRVKLPCIINGRIAQPGDLDVFEFKGKTGDEIIAEVVARRLHSPLDSLLRLTDSTGRVLEWNDDYEHKDGFLHTDMGYLTHHSDSYLSARLSKDGNYYVQLADTLTQGGEAYGYRLRIGPPRPDFALRVTPSSVNVQTGRAAILDVYALRKDGYDGEIELALENAPVGFKLSGAKIPPGKEHLRITLTAPRRRHDQPVSLLLEGRATIAGETVTRAVEPAENVMQAFLYRHLAPSKELMVAMTGRGRTPKVVELITKDPVQVPVGEATGVRLSIPRDHNIGELELKLSEPPAGISIEDVTIGPDVLEFRIAANTTASVGLMDNLIIEAFTEIQQKAKDGQAKPKLRRVSLGVLPAISIEIVRD